MFILIWLIGTAIAGATPALPVVVSLKGEVQVLTKTGENLPTLLYEGKRYSYRKARIGMQIPEGAIVVCASEARAKLVYPSGTSLWLGQGTMVKVVQAEQEPTGENSKLELVYGKLRSLVTKSKGAKWQVQTEAATDGVRGTDFVSSYSGVSGHDVTVFSGVVDVTPANQTVAKQQVQPDQTAHATADGHIAVAPATRGQVLSAYRMTILPKPSADDQAKVAALSLKSRALLSRELGSGKDFENADESSLSRKVIEPHLKNAKGSGGKEEPFSHDLDNYKKMDEGQ